MADIIIIGGGPAGLFTAIQCKLISKNKLKVIILEKNNTAGKKLLMTGAGQCNITQAGNIKDFLNHYGENKNFIRSSLYKFNNNDLINFFRKRSIDFVTNDQGKIFPKSYNAADILNTLLNECRELGVDIIANEAVLNVGSTKENTFLIETKENEYICNSLVIATGGQSYPSSGSSGDGYHFASSLGHSISSPVPALTPLHIKNYCFSELAGISLSDLKLSLWRQNKLVMRWSGDLLFTHNGLSGPGILNFSRYIKAGDLIKLHLVNVDNEAVLTNVLLEKINENGKLLLKNILKDFSLPQRLINKLMELANIPHDRKATYLNKENRTQLVKQLYSLPLEVERLGNFNVAMVTSGGVDLNEVNKKTMESRLRTNLYVVGEVLDIDGDTGGYNLQAAFSTAFLAANSITKKY